MSITLPSSSAIEPNASYPMMHEGISYRRPYPDGRDLPGMIAVEQAGWEKDLAFPPDYIQKDLKLFPGLHVLAIRRLTGEVIGRVSAVRFSTGKHNLEDMARMDGKLDWNQIYENQRDPKGPMLEGSGLVVHPQYQGLGVARRLVIAGARAILDEFVESKDSVSPIRKVTFQSRNVGFAQWAIAQGKQPNPQSHSEYVKLVLAGRINDPVLSTYANVVSEANDGIRTGRIEVINDNAVWHGDRPSAELGVRFDATAWFLEHLAS